MSKSNSKPGRSETSKQIDAMYTIRVSASDLKRIREVGYGAWSHEQDRKR